MPSERKHAVITGGTGGLGSAVAIHLANHGWDVAAPGSGELDVRDSEAVTRFFLKRRVDLLVCAAGLTLDAPLARLTEHAWSQTIDVNFHGASRCARAAIPRMIECGEGHVIFISSQSAVHPPPGQSAYAAAKSALLGMTTDLARRHGFSNIRVNAILPGFLETRMTAKLSSERVSEILDCHTLGRLNTCQAVAEFVLFLHECLPHTSGQVFQLDSRPNFSA
jgi:3-oxoacyl-[acyl-carrier protein] reductase